MLSQINDSGTNLFNGPINLPTRSLAHSPTFSGLMHLLANFTPVELSPTDINLPLVHARTRTHTHTPTPTHPLTHPPRVSLYRTGAEMWHAFLFFPQAWCAVEGTISTEYEIKKTHTLAQKYLIELLLWSASGVHKQSPKVWQENWMT